MAVTDRLAPLRAHAGQRRTQGLDDATIVRFAATHAELIDQDGLYRKLWQIQTALEEDLSRELGEPGEPGRTISTDEDEQLVSQK